MQQAGLSLVLVSLWLREICSCNVQTAAGPHSNCGWGKMGEEVGNKGHRVISVSEGLQEEGAMTSLLYQVAFLKEGMGG